MKRRFQHLLLRYANLPHCSFKVTSASYNNKNMKVLLFIRSWHLPWVRLYYWHYIGLILAKLTHGRHNSGSYTERQLLLSAAGTSRFLSRYHASCFIYRRITDIAILARLLPGRDIAMFMGRLLAFYCDITSQAFLEYVSHERHANHHCIASRLPLAAATYAFILFISSTLKLSSLLSIARAILLPFSTHRVVFVPRASLKPWYDTQLLAASSW